MLHNRYIKWTFILVCFVFFISCSDDKGSANTFPFDGNFVFNSSGNILLECSRFESKMGPTIHAQVKSFDQNDFFNGEKVQIKFTQNIDLQNKVLLFFRWRQDANGNYSADDNPLSFDINLPDGSTLPERTNISHSTVSDNIPLSQMLITVHNLPLSFQALQIAIFDTNNNGNIIAYADGLLPRFEAHPRFYNDSHRNQNLLQNLHPYRSESTSTKSQEEFANRSYQDFCF